jgi:hypothetical protein
VLKRGRAKALADCGAIVGHAMEGGITKGIGGRGPGICVVGIRGITQEMGRDGLTEAGAGGSGVKGRVCDRAPAVVLEIFERSQRDDW